MPVARHKMRPAGSVRKAAMVLRTVEIEANEKPGEVRNLGRSV